MKDYQLAAEQLAAIVAASGVTMEAAPTTRTDWGPDERAGHYRCKLTSKRASHVLTYSVGSGILADWGRKKTRKKARAPRGYAVHGWKASDLPRSSARISKHEEAHLARVREVYRPSVADVIASLLLDTSDWEADMSFREWTSTGLANCAEWKSPADALDAYEQIRASARFLAAAFTPEQLQEARDCASRL